MLPGEPFSRQGVAYRSDHYRHCPLMDIYECTNQRQPLPGFNAIRIDYIDSGRRRNSRRSSLRTDRSFRSLGLPTRGAGLSGASKESGISGKLLPKCNRGERLEQLVFFARNGTEEGSYFLLLLLLLLTFITEQLRPILREVCNLVLLDK